ncbi:MAG: stage II sporulation protein M [Patescibacteria group bacterium]|jgi:stage II sporulation protein M
MGKINKRYYFLSIILFLVSVIVGYIVGINGLEQARETVIRNFADFGFLRELPPLTLFLFIFLNNAIKALLAISLGFVFGILPIYFLVTNGKLIGLVIAIVASNRDLGFALSGLLPHGFTESIALIISASYGLWLGGKSFRRLFYRESFGDAYKISLSKYAKIVLPLLLLSAAIEVYITPSVMDLTR